MAHNKQQSGLEAFCSTCPSSQQVDACLQQIGFRLVFQMDAVIYPRSSHTKPLPAQRHYQDSANNEVMYLAGPDPNHDDVQLPPHASRFWLYPGVQPEQARRVAHALAAQWSLTWQNEQPVDRVA